MKKVMVALAIACVATFAQAAAIDWSANAVCDPVATAAAGKNTPASGYVGYVIMASSYDSVIADLDAGKTDSLVSSHVGAVKTTTSKGGFSTGAATGDVAAGSQSFYLVVLNADSAASATGYAVSAMTTATIDASLDTTIGFGSMAAATRDASTWKSVGGGSVPEPTTGLLVLLGLAGLALKRKVA